MVDGGMDKLNTHMAHNPKLQAIKPLTFAHKGATMSVMVWHFGGSRGKLKTYGSGHLPISGKSLV